MKNDTRTSLRVLLLSVVLGFITAIVIVISALFFFLRESSGDDRSIHHYGDGSVIQEPSPLDANKNSNNDKSIHKYGDGSVIHKSGPLSEEGKRILVVDLIQMTPIEIYFSDGHPNCSYSEFYYLAVINMDTERFIKTILVRAPSTFLINEVKVNGIEATYTEYPPMDLADSKAYAIPTLKSQAGLDMDIEVTFFSGEKDIKKVVLHTKREHWGFLEQRVAKYLFE